MADALASTAAAAKTAATATAHLKAGHAAALRGDVARAVPGFLHASEAWRTIGRMPDALNALQEGIDALKGHPVAVSVPLYLAAGRANCACQEFGTAARLFKVCKDAGVDVAADMDTVRRGLVSLAASASSGSAPTGTAGGHPAHPTPDAAGGIAPHAALVGVDRKGGALVASSIKTNSAAARSAPTVDTGASSGIGSTTTPLSRTSSSGAGSGSSTAAAAAESSKMVSAPLSETEFAAALQERVLPKAEGDIPTPLEQRFHIARFCAQYAHRGVKARDAYALLPSAWWKTWCAYVGGFSYTSDIAPCIAIFNEKKTMRFDAADAAVLAHYPALAAAAETAGTTMPPGVLDTRSLVAPFSVHAETRATCLCLSRDAVPDVDYELVGKPVLDAFTAWYGRRGPALVRLAVPLPVDEDEAAAGAGSSSLASPVSGGSGSTPSSRAVVDLFPELKRFEPVVAAVTPVASSPAGAVRAVAGATPTAMADGASASAPQRCVVCNKASTTRCSRCRAVHYCSRECQSGHWAAHKAFCFAPGSEEAARLAVTSKVGGAALNGRVGLVNMGNTCFMNSALQALSAAFPLTSYFLRGTWKEELNPRNVMGTGGKLATAYAELMRGLWYSPASTHYVRPMQVKYAIGNFQDRFSGFAQHDAQELLNFLLDGLHEDLNRVLDKKYVEDEEANGRADAEFARVSWEKYLARNRSIVVDLFGGQLKNTLVCPTCAHISIKFDPYHMLSLPLPSSSTRTLVVRVERHPVDLASPAAWIVPRARHASAAVFGEADARAAVWNREHRYEVHAIKIERSSRGGSLRASIARETGIPLDRVFIYRSAAANQVAVIADDTEIGVLLKDWDETMYAVEMVAPITRLPSPDALLAASAAAVQQVAPAAATEDAAANHELASWLVDDDARATAAAAVAPACVPGAPTERVMVMLEHYALSAGMRESITGDVDAGVPLQTLLTDSEPVGQPLLLTLPRAASVAQLRMALARAILCMLDWDALKLWAQAHCADAGKPADALNEGDVVYLLAMYLPLAFVQSAQRGVRTHWLPSFDAVGSAHPAPTPGAVALDARHLPIDAAAACAIPAQAMGVMPFARAALLWRGDWAALLKRDGLTSAYFMPSYQDAVALRAAKAKEVPRITLQDCLSQFVRPEVLDEHNMWYCSKCKEHVQATKTLEVWNLPEVLVCHIKRFEARGLIWREKLQTVVDFPLVGLDLTHVQLAAAQAHGDTGKGVDPAVYDCFAVVNHFGSLSFGHYTAFANHAVARDGAATSPGQWYNFDDDSVSPTPAHNVVSGAAYILFYRRRAVVAA